MTEPLDRRDASGRGLADVEIPVGGSFWRALGQNGALVVGYGLVVLHLVVLALVAIVLSGDSMRYSSGRRWGNVVTISTVLLPLLAMCFIWIGELIRRGQWGGPSGHKPEALLPQGTNTVSLRMVPVRWNLTWVAVTVVGAVVLLWLTVQDTVGYAFGGHLEIILIVNGIMAAGALGTAVGTLVKKLAWLRGGRSRVRNAVAAHPALARRQAPTLGTTFWRALSYRWRFDVWLCALGAVSAWLAGYSLLTIEHIPDSDSAAWIFGSVAVVLMASGLWATTQFWRAGEDLASGESVA